MQPRFTSPETHTLPKAFFLDHIKGSLATRPKTCASLPSSKPKMVDLRGHSMKSSVSNLTAGSLWEWSYAASRNTGHTFLEDVLQSSVTRTGLADSLRIMTSLKIQSEYSTAVDFYQGPAPANQYLKQQQQQQQLSLTSLQKTYHSKAKIDGNAIIGFKFLPVRPTEDGRLDYFFCICLHYWTCKRKWSNQKSDKMKKQKGTRFQKKIHSDEQNLR